VTTLRGETKERWRELCERAIVEQDPDRFVATIQELLQELEERDKRAAQRDRVRVPPGDKPANVSCPVAFKYPYLSGWFSSPRRPVLLIHRRNVVSDAPFY
jgi:hypothetical protein